MDADLKNTIKQSNKLKDNIKLYKQDKEEMKEQIEVLQEEYNKLKERENN
jgi:hypothetical protein